MRAYCQIEEEHGVFSVVVPPFNDDFWPELVPPCGYCWLQHPSLDLQGKLDPLVNATLFGPEMLDLRCSLHQLSLDVSIPAVDFLRFVPTRFRHRVDLLHSEKHQPPGFRWASIRSVNWRTVMIQNQIRLVLHRPDGGEPTLLMSLDQDWLKAIVGRFSSPGETIM